MRLFPKVDGAVDRFERAGLLTMPFDLAFGEEAAEVLGGKFTAAQVHHPGFKQSELHHPGFKASQVNN